MERYQQLMDEIREMSDEVTLVAVTKTATVDQIMEVYDAGHRDFGENRLQDALPKMLQLPEDIHWHFIGHLQTNKVAKVVSYFDKIHSVDSIHLAEKIASQEIKRPVLLEVNVSGEESKHGFSTDELLRQFDSIQRLDLQVEGLMTMAPFDAEESVVRNCFRRLRELRDQLGLKELSMGMTQDWRIAIEEGATFVRIGSAIFGKKS